MINIHDYRLCYTANSFVFFFGCWCVMNWNVNEISKTVIMLSIFCVSVVLGFRYVFVLTRLLYFEQIFFLLLTFGADRSFFVPLINFLIWSHLSLCIFSKYSSSSFYVYRDIGPSLSFPLWIKLWEFNEIVYNTTIKWKKKSHTKHHANDDCQLISCFD